MTTPFNFSPPDLTKMPTQAPNGDWLDIGKLLQTYQNQLTANSAISSSNPGMNLLLNTKVNWQQSPQGLQNQANTGGPSVISRIFDLLSRGQYASAEAARQLVTNDNADENPLQQVGDVVHGAISGLAGTRKTSYSDVLAEMDYNDAVANAKAGRTGSGDLQPSDFYDPNQTDQYKRLINTSNPDEIAQLSDQQAGRIQNNRMGNAMTGLLGDIFLDPTTYLDPFKPLISVGSKFVGKGAVDIQKAAQLAKDAQDATKVQPAPVLPESFMPQPATSAASTMPPTTANFINQAISNPTIPKIYGNPSSNLLKAIMNAPGSPSESDAILAIANHNTGYSGDLKVLLQRLFPNNAIPDIPEIPQPSLSTVATHIQPGVTNAPFPKVQIPQVMQNAITSSNRNAVLKDLITKITGQTTETLPKGLGKMNKADLTQTLQDLQKSHGVEALTNLAQQTAETNPGAWGFKPIEQAAQSAPNPSNLIANVGKLSNQAISDSRKAQEAQKATQLADEYSQQVLQQPNQFQKGAETPAVNNPAQQVNFFNNRILPAAKELYPNASPIGQYAKAHSLLKVAEDHLASNGLTPSFWDKSPMKLSDIMTQAGRAIGGMSKLKQDHLTQIMTALGNGTTANIANPKLSKAIDSIITARKMANTPYVQMAIDSAAKKADVAKEVLSQPGYEAFKKSIASMAQDEALAKAGAYQFYDEGAKDFVSPVNTKFGQAAIKGILENETPTEKAVRTQSTPVLKYISSDGKASYVPVATGLTNAIHKTIGGQSLKELGNIIGPKNAAEHWLLSRIATWYGNRDLRPEVLSAKGTALANANRRAAILNKIAHDYSPQEIKDAFEVASNNAPQGAANPRIAGLAADLQKSIQNLVTGSGLTDYATKASVAGRSGMTLSDLNHQMKILGAGEPFTNAAKVADIRIPGQFRDYSKGADWLKSWENAKVSDPLEFMHKLQVAVEQLTHKYGVLDEFGGRFGVPLKDAKNGFTTQVDDSRLRGLFFQPEIAKQMATVLKNWDSTLGRSSSFIKMLDNVISKWKTGMTIYSPSHHIRNLEGDIFNSWIAGVNNPDMYRKAMSIIRSQSGRYNSLDSVEKLISHTAVQDAMRSPDKAIIRTKSGIDLSPRQIYTLAHNKGLLQAAHVQEDITNFGSKLQPFGGRVSSGIRNYAEAQEHMVKLAHFMDILKKTPGKNVNQLAEQAARQVRKWHPDGLDLTKFERKYMRRIFPFYSWTRKAFPLVIESMLTKPGKTMVYPKFMHAMAGVTGMPQGSNGDPFPKDQLFPSWLQEKGIGPIGRAGAPGLAGLIGSLGRSIPDNHGNASGYTFVNPSNPVNDIISQFGGSGSPIDPLKGAMQMLNPFARTPMELAVDKTALGPPPSNDYAKYFASQVPGLQYLQSMTNATPFGPTNRGVKEGYFSNPESLINFLTAIGLHGSGPDIKSAQFEQRQRVRDAKKAAAQNNGGG